MRTLGVDIGGSSVKVALFEDGEVNWTGQSPRYARPNSDQLIAALRNAAGDRAVAGLVIGICAPGLLEPGSATVSYSVNVPGLNGIPLGELIRGAWGDVGGLRVVNDAFATAVDIVASMELSGRVLVLALGTGVGAGLLEEGKPVAVNADSPGHIGQVDVSLDAGPPIGPDGGAGSLEAYIGSAALIGRYGSMERFFSSARATDPPLRALARAIRICHAIYRPEHVVLAGGIGIRLKHLIDDLKREINRDLTRVARSNWTFQTGQHDFHAAIGAARLAGTLIGVGKTG